LAAVRLDGSGGADFPKERKAAIMVGDFQPRLRVPRFAAAVSGCLQCKALG
jgi:hypothetical protein